MNAKTVHTSATTEDDDGWVVPRCSCGWSFGPVPDHETATDALMDHVAFVSAEDIPEPKGAE